eukprot:1106423-Rhodomonas_salina.1
MLSAEKRGGVRGREQVREEARAAKRGCDNAKVPLRCSHAAVKSMRCACCCVHGAGSSGEAMTTAAGGC